PIEGEFIQRFQKLAGELKIHLILGFLEADTESDRTFNTAALIGPDGKLIGTYHKTHFHQGYEVNPPGYTAGNDYPVYTVKDPKSDRELKVGMMICFDRQLPEPARQLTLNGADLIACPSYGSWGGWNTRLMQVRAYENHAYVVFSHPKQSLLIDRNGEIMQEGTENGFAISTINLDKLEKTRQSVRNRRPETYQEQPAQKAN
ncbi:MAG: carbon-nitrogen hydrolase family protein, partial [Planctomycetaceae bacterium]|nr:carbon-nitrogen hydrolase family protein [Planctomycetaceae bacterium]